MQVEKHVQIRKCVAMQTCVLNNCDQKETLLTAYILFIKSRSNVTVDSKAVAQNTHKCCLVFLRNAKGQ